MLFVATKNPVFQYSWGDIKVLSRQKPLPPALSVSSQDDLSDTRNSENGNGQRYHLNLYSFRMKMMEILGINDPGLCLLGLSFLRLFQRMTGNTIAQGV